MIPILAASVPSIVSPVKIMRIVAPFPAIFGMRWVAPLPGISPTLIYGSPNVVCSFPTIISHNSAISKPSPKQYPDTAAITGFLKLWSIFPVYSAGSNSSIYSVFFPTKSLISAPILKAFSPPVRTMTFASSSLSKVIRA